MILVAIGANLPGKFASPADAIEAAFAELDRAPLRVAARSRIYESPPWPQPSTQPWYANAVVRLETELGPEALLAHLHSIEREFGRVRGELNAARTLDLDLIDYDGKVQDGPPILPHPRMGDRAFVLYPLAEIAPDWRHPVLDRSVSGLIAGLPPETVCRPLPPRG